MPRGGNTLCHLLPFSRSGNIMKMDVMSVMMLALNDISPTSMYQMCIAFVAPMIMMLIASLSCRLHLRPRQCFAPSAGTNYRVDRSQLTMRSFWSLRVHQTLTLMARWPSTSERNSALPRAPLLALVPDAFAANSGSTLFAESSLKSCSWLSRGPACKM